MPNYDHECICCGHKKEVFLCINDLELPQTCVDCGGDMKRLITIGHGGVHGDVPISEKDRHTNWIDTTNVGLTHKNPNHKYGRPITNRTELKQRMEEKGVVHTD